MRCRTRRRHTRLASFAMAAALATAMIVAPIPAIPFGEAAEARCAATTPYAAAVLDTPGVVGYWRLGESSGTTACEEVAGRNGVYRHGYTLGQPGLLAAEPNTAVRLDGAKGRVLISSPPELAGATQFTAEAWVRAERLDRDQTILRRNGQYMLRLSGASLVARVWWTSGYTEVSSAPVLTVGAARHVAVTYDGSAIRLYADGREVAQRPVSGTPALGSSPNVLLFGEAGGYDNFQGHLDEVALHRAGLPASTIADRVAVASGSTTTTTTATTTTTTTAATTTTTTATTTTTTTTTTTPPPPGTPAPLCSPRSAYTDAVLGSSARAVAYWRLGEATGTVACESAARGDGTYSGGVSFGATGAIAGDPDTAVGLNGSNGRVSVSSSAALRLTTGLSMEAWIRPGAVDRSQTILRKNGQYMVRANGQAIMARLWWSASAYTEVTSGPVLTAGAVTHVVVTYNGFAVVIYANGAEVGRRVVSGQPSLASSSNPLLLGEAGGYDWFLGQLDEVALYGAALPASEVANHAAFRAAGGGGGGGGGTTSTLVWAAGDIAGCDTSGDEATAALLDGTTGVVATLGDHVYEDGTAAEFANCYDPSWGRHRSRTRPAVGDHEYRTPGASGYYGYFGAAAGPAGQGYYSYDLPGWHVVVLNSNCSVVPCAAGSAQEQWLRADLASSTHPCLLAYWHHPLFSSGAVHGSISRSLPFWQALYEAGADVVLNGNEHVYERFAQQNPSGVADPQGIRQFTNGTGGRGNYGFSNRPLATSEVRDASTFGVLRLSLDAGGYTWQYVRAGGGFGDSGSTSCH